MNAKQLDVRGFFTERISPIFLLFCILNNFWSTMHFSNNGMGDYISSYVESLASTSLIESIILSLPSLAAAFVFFASVLYYWKKAPRINLKKQRMMLLYSACTGIAFSLLGMMTDAIILTLIGLICFGLLYLSLVLAFTSRATQMNLIDALLYLALGALGSFIFEGIAYVLAPVLPLTYAYLFTPCISFAVLVTYDYRHPVALKSIENITTNKNPVPIGLFLTLLVTGIIIGLTFCITSHHSTTMQTSVVIANALASFLGGFLLLAIVKKRDFNFKFLICKICFPVMAVGVFISAITALISVSETPIGLIVLLIGSQAVVTLTWVICIYLCSYKSYPLVWIVSILFLGIFLGRTVGVVSGQAIFYYFDSIQENEAFIYCLQFAFLYTIAVLLGNYDKALATSTWQEATFTSSPAVDVTEAAYAKICKNANFTPREFEIFTMLAAGRNKKFISEKLMISDNTAKTHISRVYQKMEIHSHQELLNIVERTKNLIQL